MLPSILRLHSRPQVDVSNIGDPLAKLLDQGVADLDAGQIAQARAIVAALRAWLD